LKPLKRETKFEFFLNNSSIIGGLNASASWSFIIRFAIILKYSYLVIKLIYLVFNPNTKLIQENVF
jgi:hypothetical protein